VRELRNVLYRAALSTETNRIGSKEIAESLEKAVAPQRAMLTADQARDALERHAGNVSEAARQVGLARSTFRDLLQRCPA
jgi:transcriptional regulator of acetoin/glycerol metabolism